MKTTLKLTMLVIVLLNLSCSKETEVNKQEENYLTRSTDSTCVEGLDGCLPMLSFYYDIVSSRVDIFWSGGRGDFSDPDYYIDLEIRSTDPNIYDNIRIRTSNGSLDYNAVTT